ncbi:UNVERIFIED_CONTAM: hypothetical protein K2H54_075932 [Gekko kuhli]
MANPDFCREFHVRNSRQFFKNVPRKAGGTGGRPVESAAAGARRPSEESPPVCPCQPREGGGEAREGAHWWPVAKGSRESALAHLRCEGCPYCWQWRSPPASVVAGGLP